MISKGISATYMCGAEVANTARARGGPQRPPRGGPSSRAPQLPARAPQPADAAQAQESHQAANAA